MRSDPFPLTRDLVLIGGGHTHALVLRRWGMMPLAGARMTLVDPGPVTAYSGMLPGHVAGHYSASRMEIDLMRLCRHAGARFVQGAVGGIDLAARSIAVPGRPPIAFDIASIDIGITSAMPFLPGFAEHGVPAKPLGVFAARWAAFRDGGGAAPHVAVIGAGVAGAELAMSLAHALRGRDAQVHLIDRGPALSELGATARARLRAAMRAQGVHLIENAAVTRVAADHVMLADGRRIASGFTVGAAGAQPQGWLAATGLDLHQGFVAVDAMLRTSDPAIFAAGDCAHMVQDPRPKAGVYAVRQAPVLHDNLRAALSGGALRRYRPQRDYLKLVSLGERRALAQRFGRVLEGPLLWRLKDAIDTRFMQGLSDLPLPEAPSPPRTAAQGLAEELGAAPMCGGCGAKVGRGALRGALAAQPQGGRADLAVLPGDDAALLTMGGIRQVISTDHLRAVTADPALMARIAAIHALGDIWAMGAAPQAATATVILPRMSALLQQRTLTEIMAVAAEVMAEAGAAIAGGHSSMGEELTIGFTVTGLCAAAPITLAGARPGDALILTKPLGSGVVLAAAMRDAVRAADLAATLAAMVQPQGRAAAILAGAHAMTDVTGFGLAGHLAGICEASGLAAEIDLAALPLMPGALALAGAGIGSTLAPDNRAAVARDLSQGLPEGPHTDLAFDPQTAGGLLAAVDGARAEALLAQLRAEGYPAARIGRVLPAQAARLTFLPGG